MSGRTEEDQDDGLSARIERLDTRLSGFIEREEKRKHWRDTVIPLLSLLVALAGILAATVVQVANIRSQTTLKQYEVTFVAKQKAYADVMASVHGLFFTSIQRSRDDLIRAVDKLQADTFSIQPFLTGSEQTALWEDIQQFIEFCLENHKQGSTSTEKRDETINSFTEQRDKIRQLLTRNLFAESTL